MIRLLWDSGMNREMYWNAEEQRGIALNPPRDVGCSDRQVKWPLWAISSYVLGPYHRCGQRMYYGHYVSVGRDWVPVYARGYGSSCVSCQRARQARSRAELAAARKRVGRVGGALRQLVGQLERAEEAKPAPAQATPEARQHHCHPASACRTKSGRRRIEEKGRVATFFRCWVCGCFFPIWEIPSDEGSRVERLCAAHRESWSGLSWSGLDSWPSAQWPITTAIRHCQSIAASYLASDRDGVTSAPDTD